MTAWIAALLAAAPLLALPPAQLQSRAAFAPKAGAELPADAPFLDAGRPVKLGQLLGRRPALVVPVYFDCPMLCPLTLEGLMKALRALPLSVGRDFDVIVYSFDFRDRPDAAKERLRDLVAAYRRPASATGWHVLTGDREQLGRLSSAIGFTPAWDPETARFAHDSGAVVVSADGRVKAFFGGLDFPARDLSEALRDAAAGRAPRWTNPIALLCFQYSENAARYTKMILDALRVMGALTALALGAWVLSGARRGGVS